MADSIVDPRTHYRQSGDLDWEPLAKLAPLHIHDRSAPEEIVARASQATLLLTTRRR